MTRRFETIGSERVYDGRLVDVRIDTVRYADGSIAEREIVEHRGSVAIVAHDERAVHLVRQPREAIGEPDLLELPAGKLDVEGETAEQCARRELGEETGLRARYWRELKRISTSPGFTSEQVILYLATDLERASGSEAGADEGERIQVVAWPLDDLDGAIAAASDAKTLVGLLLLARGVRDS